MESKIIIEEVENGAIINIDKSTYVARNIKEISEIIAQELISNIKSMQEESNNKFTFELNYYGERN